MPTIALTTDNFHDLLLNSDVLLIDLTAEWSVKCQRFTPVFAAVAEIYPTVTFATLDTDAEPDLAARFTVPSIPTLVIVRERVVLYARAGELTHDELVQLLEQVLATDMVNVHSQSLAQEIDEDYARSFKSAS